MLPVGLSDRLLVLSNILQDKDSKRKFLNLLKDLLPFVDDLHIQKFADKSLLFTIRETYDIRFPYLPASFVSDGTINLTALIIALYFEDQSMVIIEEPERNIHPYLISKVVSMLDEVSEKKQILVTTHNPEIVRNAKIEDLLLINRNEQGFSAVQKPAERDEVQVFLKNEIGIDELYIQNLLGIYND